MPKLRVYQLARELNRDNAEIIRELQHMGVPVTSHSNTVEDRLADRLRRELGVFVADGGKKASDGDEIVAIETPDEEVPAAVVDRHPDAHGRCAIRRHDLPRLARQGFAMGGSACVPARKSRQ